MRAPPPYTPSDTTPLPVPATPKLSVALAADPNTHDVLISIIPPGEPLDDSGKEPCKRAPVDICCVIDISGSMESELKASLEEGKAAELTGLSTLDVVKHAVKTIVATMQPDDRISIVTFSNAAKIKVGLTPMTARGKEEVLQAVQSLGTLDSTNIWDGLKTGMNVLNGLTAPPTSRTTSYPVSSARFSTLFLLTDGMPNINPPRGIIQMLKSYLDAHPLTFSIHTFGFGYSLDSQLLLQIARLGRGVYGFIPDASALGAVFIHAVANLYSMCADRVMLTVECIADGNSENASEMVVFDGLEDNITSCSTGATIDVGVVQYGQTRDFVFRMKNYPQLSIATSSPILLTTVRYRPWTLAAGEQLLNSTASLTREAIINGASGEDCLKIKHHSQRFTFIRAVDYMFRPASPASKNTGINPQPGPSHPRLSTSVSSDLLQTSVPKFKSILTALQTPPLSADASASALAGDISGEVLLALSANDTYTRWGQHYLPSLARWHLLQQCGSYRDPGLQVYGAQCPLFVNSRDALDQAFDNLPPPSPSVKQRASPYIYGYARRASSGGTMNSYTDASNASGSHAPRMSTAFASRSGPCFDGACEITLADGRKVRLRDLRRGVRVQTPKGARNVVAVLETPMQRGEALLCELPGGLRVTPWHPIKVFSAATECWVFPVSQASPELKTCSAVYSLLLEPDTDPDAHGVYIQNVLCVTLGHGITHSREDIPVADMRAHAFLGDYQRILQSLACFPDADAEGVFHIGGVFKHSISGTICGFMPHEGFRSEGGAMTDAVVHNGIAVA